MTADENENQHRHRHQPEPEHHAEPQHQPEPRQSQEARQPHPPHLQEGSGWQPIPAGEYDGDATAFVQLPPGALLDGIPLEAPGHGYVPPRIDDPHATAQWNFQEALATEEAHGHPSGPAPGGADLTGQWTIPVARGDLPEESGEYRIDGGRPAPAADWTGTGPAGGPGGGTPPATLPGGAPAPWAVEPEPHPVVPPQAPRPASEGAGAPVRDEAEAPSAAEAPGVPPEADAPVGAPGEAPAQGPGPAGGPAAPEPAAAPGVPAQAQPEGRVVADSEARFPARPDAPAPSAEPRPTADATGAATGTESGAGPVTEPAPTAVQEDPQAAAPGGPQPSEEHPHVSYVLRVNGVDRPVTEAWVGESLLYVLRERLGLAGAKDGCSQGECGACNVQVDGRLVASCLVPAATTAGSEVRTVEGLAANGEPSDVQRALARCGAVQCGFCIPGMAMTMHDLLEGNHAPTDVEARRALSGNLCRCTGYQGALRAVREVVEERRAAQAEAAAAQAAAAGEAPGQSDQQPPEVRIPHQVTHPHDGGTA